MSSLADVITSHTRRPAQREDPAHRPYPGGRMAAVGEVVRGLTLGMSRLLSLLTLDQ